MPLHPVLLEKLNAALAPASPYRSRGAMPGSPQCQPNKSLAPDKSLAPGSGWSAPGRPLVSLGERPPERAGRQQEPLHDA